MIRAADFCRRAAEHGFVFYSGVPCSYLTPFIDHVIAAPALHYIGAVDEGSAVALASGASLGGQRAVAMMQCSGLGNAVNPLTSLCAVFQIPLLLIVTWRGEPGGPPDEPQHALMGAITPRLLELMNIPWAPFPDDEAAIGPALAQADAHLARARTPYALVMKKGAVRTEPAHAAPPVTVPLAPMPTWPAWSACSEERPSRGALLAAVRSCAPDALVIATTGYTSRELYALGDRAEQLYLVGSMGLASSVALGVACAQPTRRVIVIDGDGAALMHLGALATIGHQRPSNLLHLVLDNELHESTGGQATVSGSVDFAALAHASGYPMVTRARTAGELTAAITNARDLTFVHAKVRPGVSGELPRPTISPSEVAARFAERMRA